MKYLVNLLRILVGALFIFSGAVKAIDPIGTGYKMHDYFAAFSSLGLKPFWEYMNHFAVPFSVFMIVLEIAAGIALLVGWAPKLTAWVLFLMTLFFTLLTGFTYLSGFCPNIGFGIYSVALTVLFMVSAARFNSKNGKMIFGITLLAIGVLLAMLKYTDFLFTCAFDKTKMKVTDCGCFGDFIKLQPYQTFYKDIILDVLIFIIVIGTKHIKNLFKPGTTAAVTFIGTLASLLFCFSNYMWGLPIVDFRPYKIGNNVRELRQMQRAPKIDFVFVYKNKKSGELKEFTMDELDKMNSDEWDFDARKDKVIDPGIPAKIDGFYINTEEGLEITDSLLSNPNYSIMVVAFHLAETDKSIFTEKLNPLAAKCDKAGIPFYVVYGMDIPAEPFRHEMQTAYPFYTADETPLKTIIRSNPGVVLLKNGVVINMWHKMHIPSFDELNEKYFKTTAAN